MLEIKDPKDKQLSQNVLNMEIVHAVITRVEIL